MLHLVLSILRWFRCSPISYGTFGLRRAEQNRKQRREATRNKPESRPIDSGRRPSRRRVFPRRIALTTLCALVLLSATTFAQQEQSHPALRDVAATRIEVDEEANIIRFFVDGEETMRLDAEGLHVRNDIGYGGTVTDYGGSGFDEHTTGAGEGRDAR